MKALGFLALWLLLGSPAWAADGGAAERMFARGVQAEDQKDYRKAVVYFESATLSDPSHAQVLRHLGNCRYYLGEKAKAVIAYEAYLALTPGDTKLRAFVEDLKPHTPEPTPIPAPVEGAGSPKAVFKMEAPEGGGFAALSGWQAGASRKFNLYLAQPDGKAPLKLNKEPFTNAVVEVTGLLPGRKYSFYTVALLSGVETQDRFPVAKSALEAPSVSHWLIPRDGAELAEGNQVPLLYDFTAAWCGPCKMLERDVFEDPDSAAWLNRHFILVRVMDRRAEDGRNEFRVENLQLKYHIEGYPSVVANYRDGKDERFVGYGGKEAALAALRGFAERAASKKGNE